MAFQQIRQRLGDQSGASLMIGVMALLLLGATLVAGMRYVGPKVDLQRTTQTDSSTDHISAALALYATRNGSLPCPVTGISSGAETQGSCGGSTTVWGLVPWQTLGLSPQDAVDKWGRRLTYAVAQNGSGTAAYVCNTASGGGTATWNNLTTAGSPHTAYVIISHGPNGRGAYLQNGTTYGSQITPATDPSNEAYNCPGNVTNNTCPHPSSTQYATGPYVSQSTSSINWFDDVVSANTGTGFSCLCTEPSISVLGNNWTINAPTSGIFATVSVSLASASSCNTQWTVSVSGQASDYTSSLTSNPINTPAGSTTTVTYTFKGRHATPNNAPETEQYVFTAQNLASAGWSQGAPPPSSQTLTIIYPCTSNSSGCSGGGGGGGSGTSSPPNIVIQNIEVSASPGNSNKLTKYYNDTNNDITDVGNSGTKTIVYTSGSCSISITGNQTLGYDVTNGIGTLGTGAGNSGGFMQPGDSLIIDYSGCSSVTSYNFDFYATTSGTFTVSTDSGSSQNYQVIAGAQKDATLSNLSAFTEITITVNSGNIGLVSM